MNVNYEGLVCYLNAEKSSKQNNQWIDSSGNNNNATLTNISDSDFNGNYVQFNGNNYATLPRCVQDDFTLSAEVILERSTSEKGPLHSWYNYASLIDAETSNVVNDFGLTVSKDGHVYFGVGNPDFTISYTQKSLFNEKHIITCTRNRNTGEFALYLNGNLINKQTHQNRDSLTSPTNIYIGKGKNNAYLSMKLFSVRIYNRVLDDFEIKQDNFLVKEKQYVNVNNLPAIVDKLSNASNIKITGNKYGSRVQTVIDKIVEKADDVTKAIEQEVVNDSYSFKIGTGDVDVSTDVEDGFGEVGVKGVTYQNMIEKYEFLLSDKASYENGIITVIPNIDSYSNAFIKKGSLFKPNTCYTVIFDILENTLDAPFYLLTTHEKYGASMYIPPSIAPLEAGDKGVFVYTITTMNDIVSSDTCVRSFIKNTATQGLIKYRVYILEGDHTNNPNLPSYFEGIVGVGDKSKNLFNYKLHDSIEYNGSYFTITKGSWKSNLVEYEVEPNTDYTISIDRYDGALWVAFDVDGVQFNNNNYDKFSKVIRTNETGKMILKFGANTTADLGHKFANIQLVKGTVRTPCEPYYEGHKIEILSHGKNLYKPNLQTKSANGLTFSLHGNTLIVNGTCTKIVDFRPINGTESITLELYNYVNKLPIGTTLKLSNNLGLKNFFSLKRNGVQTYPDNTLIIQKGDYGISCFVRFEEGQSYNNAELKIQLEINNVATEFEPYIEDKTQILLDEPLMRLPNGVCDEITRDGKLIRRVGKVVLTDIKDWNKALVEEKTIRFDWHSKYDAIYKSKASSHGYCDTVLYHKDNSDDKVHCRINGATPYGTLIFWVDKSQLTTETSEGFKQWLSQNPTTVYYELAEPVITELPAPYLRIFKDGHLTFNTLVAPESNHVVQLNKSGQIQNAIKESQSLDNRINVLENNYDNLMLSTISRLNDLELNYTLK